MTRKEKSIKRAHVHTPRDRIIRQPRYQIPGSRVCGGGMSGRAEDAKVTALVEERIASMKHSESGVVTGTWSVAPCPSGNKTRCQRDNCADPEPAAGSHGHGALWYLALDLDAITRRVGVVARSWALAQGDCVLPSSLAREADSACFAFFSEGDFRPCPLPGGGPTFQSCRSGLTVSLLRRPSCDEFAAAVASRFFVLF